MQKDNINIFSSNHGIKNEDMVNKGNPFCTFGFIRTLYLFNVYYTLRHKRYKTCLSKETPFAKLSSVLSLNHKLKDWSIYISTPRELKVILIQIMATWKNLSMYVFISLFTLYRHLKFSIWYNWHNFEKVQLAMLILFKTVQSIWKRLNICWFCVAEVAVQHFKTWSISFRHAQLL